MEISDSKVVRMHYKGTLENGEVFDSSESREPLTFLYGRGMIIPGLEKAIVGLKAGDKKTVNVTCEEAYGPVNDAAVQEVPKDQFPPEIELKEGLQLMAQGPEGAFPLVVKALKESSVVVDFNHPLAGKNLNFDVEIVEVREPTQEELEHGHAHGAGSAHDHGEDEEEVPEDEQEKKE
ncbi:MAG: peptidylprolyl isomerase [Candidatus Woesearchaeota archaeon]|nr:MAG: peptidylprolyl isomerase [Candidatus Woesearchaeota archaeon]